jgi:hypothetical protein
VVCESNLTRYVVPDYIYNSPVIGVSVIKSNAERGCNRLLKETLFMWLVSVAVA